MRRARRCWPEFWKVALGYRDDDPPPGFDTWDEALGRPACRSTADDANAIVDPDGVGPRSVVPEGARGQGRQEPGAPGCGRRPGIEDADDRWAAVRAHVDALVAAGGSEVDERRDDCGGHWMVMTDPDGNEFCVQ